MATFPRPLSSYQLMRQVFWRLPAPLRRGLHGPRHLLVRWLRAGQASVRGSPTDLGWEAFERTVLRPANARPPFILAPNIDWNTPLFQRPQHLAKALGETGRLVIYQTRGDDVRGFRQVAPNVWLANDPTVDAIPGAWRCFYSTSLYASIAGLQTARQRGRVVYEYIDHIDAAISGGRTITRQLQAVRDHACAGGADLVVTSAASLQAEALRLGRDVNFIHVPNGVHVADYAQPGELQEGPSPSLLRFCQQHRRIVGYFGAIAPWLWYEVLDQLALALPDTGFVFIGPDYGGCAPSLPQRPNAHHVGPVPYAALAAFAGLFDICFIPFRPGDIARSTSPLKLFEYFALEKPVVVTTDLHECTAFEEVFAGSDLPTLIDAIERAYAQRHNDVFKRRLKRLAQENDWAVRAQTYAQALEALEARGVTPARTSP